MPSRRVLPAHQRLDADDRAGRAGRPWAGSASTSVARLDRVRAARRPARAGGGCCSSRSGRTARRPRRRSLAAYIATSARWSRRAASSPCSGQTAMPMLAPTSSVSSPMRERRVERLAQLARRPPSRRRVGAAGRQEDGELVAAEPGDRAARRDDGRAGGRRPRCSTVADVVAERVVDLLEPVEVHEHHRHRRCRPVRGRARRSTRSWNSARLGSPVSGSCSAWCSFSAASSRSRSTRRPFSSATLAWLASVSNSLRSSPSNVLTLAEAVRDDEHARSTPARRPRRGARQSASFGVELVADGSCAPGRCARRRRAGRLALDPLPPTSTSRAGVRRLGHRCGSSPSSGRRQRCGRPACRARSRPSRPAGAHGPRAARRCSTDSACTERRPRVGEPVEQLSARNRRSARRTRGTRRRATTATTTSSHHGRDVVPSTMTAMSARPGVRRPRRNTPPTRRPRQHAPVEARRS